MVVPHEVALAPRVFVNRQPDFEWMDGFLSRDGAGARVGVCSGLPGVGKTAFVRRCVERARAARMFADGELCVEFGSGHDGRTSVADALAACLAALGVSAEAIPASLAERVNRWRSLTAEKSVLIVLEDVTDAAQVLPFVPVGSASVVLVTSNGRLTELVLDGADFRRLEPLNGAAGAHLITELVGDRARQDPGAVAELVRQCAGLPVALKIAVGKLMARPGLAIRSLVAAVAADSSGLALFTTSGWEKVAAVFSNAYDTLDEESARLYRLLSVFPGQDLTAATAAALIDRDFVTTDAAIATLVEAGLLAEDSAQRLSLHSLLQRHASQLSKRLDQERDRIHALRGVVRHLLVRAAFADRAILGAERYRCTPQTVLSGYRSLFVGGDARRDSLDWMDGERANLLAVQRVAVTRGWHDWAWQLAEALTALYVTRRYYVDWIVSSELGASAAGLVGNRRAEARLRSFVSRAWTEHGRPERAREELMERALPLADTVGDGRLLASVWELIGRYRDATGDPAGAAAAYARSLALFGSENDSRGTAFVTLFLAQALRRQGDLEHAEATADTALTLIRGLSERDRRMEGRCLTELGRILDERGRADRARVLFDDAVGVLTASGDRFYAAAAHERLLHIGERTRDEELVRASLEQMIRIHSALGSDRVGEFTASLSRLTGR
jgi:tetratricopeptide (TPR) repeat protein